MEINNIDTSYTAPDFSVPEYQKDEKWAANMVRWGANYYYNKAPYQFRKPVSGRNLTTLSSVERMVRAWSYVMGEQEMGINRANLSKEVRAAYRSGLDVQLLVRSKVGKVTEIMQNAAISAELLSPEAKSKKQVIYNLRSMYLANKDTMEFLKSLNILFNPLPPNVAIETQRDLDKEDSLSLKQKAEKYGVMIGNYLWEYNDCIKQFNEAARQACVTGLAGLEVYSKGGVACLRGIQGHQAIWDFNDTDVFLSNQEVSGYVIYRMTPNEILDKYPNLSKEDQREIQEMNNANFNAQFITTYNAPINNTNFWYYLNANNSVGGCSVVKIYAYGKRDSTYKGFKDGTVDKIKYKDSTGKIKKEYENEKGDYSDCAWYEGELIGNKYIQNWGLVANQIPNTTGKRTPCPLQFVAPNITLDIIKSDVMNIQELQDEIDYYANKIKESAIKAKGKGLYINGVALGLQERGLKGIVEDLESFGITVGTVSGEVMQGQTPEGSNLKIQPIDITMSDDVDRWLKLQEYLKKEIREAMSLPDVALGLQNEIIGRDVQQNTMKASSIGLASYYDTMLNYFQKVIQLLVNTQKAVYAAEDMDDIIEMQIGMEGLSWYRENGGWSFEDMGVYMKLNDIVDSKNRDALISAAEIAAANNPTPQMQLYVVKLRSLKTYSDVEEYLEWMNKDIIRQQEKNEAIAHQRQMELAKENNAAALQGKSLAPQATVEVANIKTAGTNKDTERLAQAKERTADIQGKDKVLATVLTHNHEKRENEKDRKAEPVI